METHDYYAILGLDQSATQEEIKQRYRFLSHAYHPDKFGNPTHKAMGESEFKRINEAYEILSNPTTRDAYDRSRRRNHSNPKTETHQASQTQTPANHDTSSFNWGAFIYGPIWAAFNGLIGEAICTIAAYFLPSGVILSHIALGFYGTKWAWKRQRQQKDWNSFQNTQRTWAKNTFRIPLILFAGIALIIGLQNTTQTPHHPDPPKPKPQPNPHTQPTATTAKQPSPITTILPPFNLYWRIQREHLEALVKAAGGTIDKTHETTLGLTIDVSGLKQDHLAKTLFHFTDTTLTATELQYSFDTNEQLALDTFAKLKDRITERYSIPTKDFSPRSDISNNPHTLIKDAFQWRAPDNSTLELVRLLECFPNGNTRPLITILYQVSSPN